MTYGDAKMKTLLGMALGILMLCAAPAMAEQRSISVSGSAKEEVAPDQAVLSIGLVSKNPDLAAAKKHNDGLVEKLVAIITKFEIPKQKVATSNVYIAPEYTYNATNGQQTLAGYIVNRSLRITVDKLDSQEKLLSAIVDAKISDVNGLDMQLAKPEEVSARLRVKAFEDAKRKADALAVAAGGKLGPALTITTDNIPMMPSPRPMMQMAAKSSAAESVAPSLPGMITVQESVNVTFGLE